MTTGSRFVAFSAVAVCVLLTGAGAGAAAKPSTHKVLIDGTRFQPDVLTVKAGDSIVWINNDPFPHTATSEAGGFDSKRLDTGESWKDLAAKKGEFEYTCTFHPSMKASLRVK